MGTYYRSWSLPERGTSGILVENNVVYDTQGPGMRLQIGSNCHIIINNIFAFARTSSVDMEIAKTNVFVNNVVHWNKGKLFTYDKWANYEKFISRNVYWRPDGEPILRPGHHVGGGLRVPDRDDLPRGPRRVRSRGGADHLRRPRAGRVEDQPRDRARGDMARAAATPRRPAQPAVAGPPRPLVLVPLAPPGAAATGAPPAKSVAVGRLSAP